MNINRTRTLANISDRAARITEDYRLVWNRHEQAFYVTHKTDRTRRYLVTTCSCACPSYKNYGDCKHRIGLPALLQVEIARYQLLGFAADLKRTRDFLAEVELAEYAEQIAMLESCEDTRFGCDPYAEF